MVMIPRGVEFSIAGGVVETEDVSTTVDFFFFILYNLLFNGTRIRMQPR